MNIIRNYSENVITFVGITFIIAFIQQVCHSLLTNLNSAFSDGTLHYITFYLADAFIQSDVQSSAIQGHTTTMVLER